MEFFATSVDTLRWHPPTCNSMATADKEWEEEEESENDGNSDEDDGYLLEEI